MGVIDEGRKYSPSRLFFQVVENLKDRNPGGAVDEIRINVPRVN